MINLKTKESIEKLASITDYKKQKKIISKYPEVILYASKYWAEGKDFDKLVEEALKKNPSLIVKFKGKNGLILNASNITTAILSDPMVISKFDQELKDKISTDLFLRAFVINPLVLTIPGIKAMNKRMKMTTVVLEDGVYVEKPFSPTVKSECLKAIRLSEKTSIYHPGYDDFALALAKKLTKSKSFQKAKYSEELLSNCATLMNVLIKQNNQKLRACSAKQWLVNKGKPMYKAIRVSAKKNSQLEGLIEDMPTDMLPEKTVKKLIITAILTNPDMYIDLPLYGFEKYVDDPTVKYNVYKSLKKHGMLKNAKNYLSEEDIKKSKNKLAGVEKRNKIKQEEEISNNL